ncbi:TPA: hypothetical protein ACPZT9_000380 [Yersinia enterocolitica]
MTNITPTTTQSVEMIASIVGKKLAIDGQEARRMAITGALAGVTNAYYSRQHSPSDIKQP